MVISRNAHLLLRFRLDETKSVNVLIWEDATLAKIDRETARRAVIPILYDLGRRLITQLAKVRSSFSPGSNVVLVTT